MTKLIDNIDDLRNFVGIVDHGGLTAAVSALETPKSTLSRRLAGLEAHVGTRLINRSERSFQLTEAGSIVYGHAVRILAEIERLREAIQPGEPAGLLRITTSYALAINVLGPLLPAFMEMYPRIEIDLEASSQLRDLARDDFDIALRAGPLSGGASVAKRLGKSEIGLFASPAFLSRVGETAETVSSRPIIGLNRNGKRQQAAEGMTAERDRRSKLHFNDPQLIKAQLLSGFGTGWLPVWMASPELEAGQLLRCRPELSFRGGELFVLYNSRKDMPAKTRVFVDFLAERINR